MDTTPNLIEKFLIYPFHDTAASISILFISFKNPQQKPKFFWVEIYDYVGNLFFSPENKERKKWVPIYPVTAEDYSSRDKTLSTTMLP